MPVSATLENEAIATVENEAPSNRLPMATLLR